jgi:hypothetical protein
MSNPYTVVQGISRRLSSREWFIEHAWHLFDDQSDKSTKQQCKVALRALTSLVEDLPNDR